MRLSRGYPGEGCGRGPGHAGENRTFQGLPLQVVGTASLRSLDCASEQ
jgi:hypothetical protein